jgi:hypothetical protein
LVDPFYLSGSWAASPDRDMGIDEDSDDEWNWCACLSLQPWSPFAHVYHNDAGIMHVRRVLSVMFLVPASSCQPSEVNLCAGHVLFRTCSCIHLDPISPRLVQSQWRYRHHYNWNDLDFSLLHVIVIPHFHSFFLGLECFSIGDWREQYPVQLLRLGRVLLLKNSQEFAEWWIYAWSCIDFYWEESYVETPLNQLLFYCSNHLCSLTAAKVTTITVFEGNVE